MNSRAWVVLFLVFDWLVACVSWSLFFYFRKTRFENSPFEVDSNFIIGLILLPFLWLFIYYLQGSYYQIRRIYRLKILNLTFFGTLLGATIIFLYFFWMIKSLITECITGLLVYSSPYSLFFLLSLD
jgi:hypothetical protein